MGRQLRAHRGRLQLPPLGEPTVYVEWPDLRVALKLEQTNLWNEINFNLPPTAVDNTTSTRRTIEAFVCPSNGKAAAVATGGSTTVKLGPSDYRGNWRPTVTSSAPTPLRCSTNPLDLSTSLCTQFDNGVTYKNSAVSMADITDGTTSTMFIGEVIYPKNYWSDATQLVCSHPARPDDQQADHGRDHELLDLLGEQALGYGQLRPVRRQCRRDYQSDQ